MDALTITTDNLERMIGESVDMDKTTRVRVRALCEAMIEFAAEAVKAEREACAKIADKAIDLGYSGGCSKYEIAEAIRARSTVPTQGS